MVFPVRLFLKCAIPPIIKPVRSPGPDSQYLARGGCKKGWPTPPPPSSPAGTLRQPCPALGAGACLQVNGLWECRRPTAQQDSIRKDRPPRTVLGPSHF